MKALHNIVKSKLCRGEYVGYTNYDNWTIRRTGNGNWAAYPQGNQVALRPSGPLHAYTLASMSQKLAQIDAPAVSAPNGV